MRRVWVAPIVSVGITFLVNILGVNASRRQGTSIVVMMVYVAEGARRLDMDCFIMGPTSILRMCS